MPLKVDPKFISDAMTTDSELAGKVAKDVPSFNKTITAGGVTGDRTINTPAGTVNFAAGMQQITVTSSICLTTSIVIPVVRTVDVNATIFSCVPSNGSFLITLAAPPDIEVSVGFLVIN